MNPKSLTLVKDPNKLAAIIQSLGGVALDNAIRTEIESEAKSPTTSLMETWDIAARHNTESWHKFRLSCDADLWDAEFSGMFAARLCGSPQEAILRALLMDKFSLAFDVDSNGYRIVE